MKLHEFLHKPGMNEGTRKWSLWWFRQMIVHPVYWYRMNFTDYPMTWWTRGGPK